MIYVILVSMGKFLINSSFQVWVWHFWTDHIIDNLTGKHFNKPTVVNSLGQISLLMQCDCCTYYFYFYLLNSGFTLRPLFVSIRFIFLTFTAMGYKTNRFYLLLSSKLTAAIHWPCIWIVHGVVVVISVKVHLFNVNEYVHLF